MCHEEPRAERCSRPQAGGPRDGQRARGRRTRAIVPDQWTCREVRCRFRQCWRHGLSTNSDGIFHTLAGRAAALKASTARVGRRKGHNSAALTRVHDETHGSWLQTRVDLQDRSRGDIFVPCAARQLATRGSALRLLAFAHLGTQDDALERISNRQRRISRRNVGKRRCPKRTRCSGPSGRRSVCARPFCTCILAQPQDLVSLLYILATRRTIILPAPGGTARAGQEHAMRRQAKFCCRQHRSTASILSSRRATTPPISTATARAAAGTRKLIRSRLYPKRPLRSTVVATQ